MSTVEYIDKNMNENYCISYNKRNQFYWTVFEVNLTLRVTIFSVYAGNKVESNLFTQ